MEGFFPLLPKDPEVFFFMNGREKYLPNEGSGSAKTRNLYLRIHNVRSQEFFDNVTKRTARKKMEAKIKWFSGEFTESFLTCVTREELCVQTRDLKKQISVWRPEKIAQYFTLMAPGRKKEEKKNKKQNICIQNRPSNCSNCFFF